MKPPGSCIVSEEPALLLLLGEADHSPETVERIWSGNNNATYSQTLLVIDLQFPENISSFLEIQAQIGRKKKEKTLPLMMTTREE